MYVILRVILFSDWRQFSKSWTPSFLPYPCSVTHCAVVQFRWDLIVLPHNEIKVYQPLCVSFYYIIYSKCMYFWVAHFMIFTDANFQKAGRLHSCLTLAPQMTFSVYFFVVYPQKTKQKKSYNQPLCVSFYYTIYIVNVCFFEWYVLQIFTDANSQKAGRLHSCLIPAPEYLILCCLFVIVPQ